MFNARGENSTPDTVLFVDDEENILNSIDRLFAGADIKILKAVNAAEALDLLSKEKIAVIVSDNQMPGTKGTELLSRVRDVSPDTVKILMTAYADLETAVTAINKSEVFRFIVKPLNNDVLIGAVREAITRCHIVQTLKKDDETILFSLAQTIELKDHYTREHCENVANYAMMIAEALNFEEEAKKNLKYGSWLHDCGKIGVPEDILNKKGILNEEEYNLVKKHPRWGADVAEQANMSRSIVNIILHHHERYDGKGYPSRLKGRDIPFEARIVTIADVFDAMTSERPYRTKLSLQQAAEKMLLSRGSVFDPELLEIFLSRCFHVNR
ncbi:MAG: HD domain-containing phosphohydrolase [Nitrospirota bacterium]|nr:HD domain-containing phosphohydrolase [Nitrospirota bacterium]